MKPGNSKRVTIEQIAKRCGVSSMTVARALRPGQPVADATRKRIVETAEALGYQPRAMSGRPRIPRQGERTCVEVIVGMALHSVFYSELLTTIEQELAANGFNCIVRSASENFEAFLTLSNVLRETPVAPTLIVGYVPLDQLRTLLEVRPYALLVDHTGDPRLETPCSSIGFDNAQAANLALRHLLSIGRKRILLLTGFQEHYFTREIEQGYRNTLQSAGHTIDPALILRSDFTVESAIEMVETALDSGTTFDAVFTTDEMGAGLLRLLHMRGLRVPEDVALVGCDGIPSSQYTIPSITTVVLDYTRLGRLAVEHILNNKAPEDHRHVRLVPHLEERESTAL